MQEKIGNVVLDYEYYPGEDLYSDGPIEEELLELARLHLDDYSALISQKSSWPVVYHFSKIRQNIIEWIPIEPESSRIGNRSRMRGDYRRSGRKSGSGDLY